MNHALTLSVAGFTLEDHALVRLAPGLDFTAFSDHGLSVRHNLLFPVSPSHFKLPQKDFKLQFLASPNPFGLIHYLEKKNRDKICFSLGAMAVVVVTDVEDQFDSTSGPDYAPVTVWEKWTILDGKLQTPTRYLPETDSISSFQIDIPEDSDPTLRITLTELKINLSRALHFANLFARDSVPDFLAAIDDVQATVQHLGELKPLLLKAHSIGAKDATLADIKRHMDSDIEHLVHMNSALVYLTTQAFHGTIPILSHIPLVSHHGILGTGTAWRGISRLTHVLFEALNEPRLPPILAKLLLTDTEGEGPGHGHRRIVHFSGRLGFGETDVTITCPSQVITLCSTPEWSVVTITHEVLHAYVKRILAALLYVEQTDGQVLMGAEARDWHAEKMCMAIIRWGRRFAENGPTDAAGQLMWGVFQFALAHDAAETEYRLQVSKGQLSLPENLDITAPRTARQLVEVYSERSMLIEELMVHVLDLHYFYGRDPNLFTESLWVTWAAVPSVLGRLEYYVTRTLIAVASIYPEDSFQPLTQSFEVLKHTITKLERLPAHHAVAGEVLRLLENHEFRLRVDLLFPEAIKFVRTIMATCEAPTIAEALSRYRDPLSSADGDYGLEEGSFDATEIKDSLAFALALLRRRLHSLSADHDSFDRIARESAWLLLGLASSPPPEQ